MSFKLKGADGKTIAIPDSEYYFNTKARARRLMLNSLSAEARRVYTCLELATMGFQQELAVMMTKQGIRPLTPFDIHQQTELSKQHVRRALEELEAAGLAKRVAPDGGALRKGQVHVYSWAVPRPAEKKNSSRARLLFPEWFPDSWTPLTPLINRFKYKNFPDIEAARGYFAEGEEVAAGYQKAEIVAVAFLDRVCAGAKPLDAPLLLERTERTVERTEREVGRSVGVSVGSSVATPTYLPDPPAVALIPDPRNDPAFRELVRVVEAVAVPVIGEHPTEAQYIEIHQRLKGASTEHYRERLEAKKAKGKLNSVMVLVHLADDCAKTKDKWKPPVQGKPAGKSFVGDVAAVFARRLTEGTI